MSWRRFVDRHQAPKKHSVYCFVEREKMNDIFTELNLETLAAVFRREIIVPSIVQSMSIRKKGNKNRKSQKQPTYRQQGKQIILTNTERQTNKL